ncbi:hypothetical protein [Azospirillum brasilense]|uniref:hypothetical protein n=1 Tax=Azospirillum brasilense TaxID=192 RepID=UPI000E6777A0|nr:hypothetical protein [Azospirillum brasilense]NUB24298.1 hypothetical protein [Azospirillum brasilense]NUB30092.1 hypothetical protein [Azospirillum brasilense]RIW04951.1 hypothetical protein D2T81_08940 [Azospirillum brasilense]
MSTAPSTELAVLPPALVPATVFAPGGVETILTKLEADVRTAAKDLDISTDKGRKAIASLAYKVARSKTALDDMGKGLVEETKKQVALIDADRRVIRDRLDALKDEVRRPLDEYEAAEKARIERHESGIVRIQAMPLFSGERSTDDIAARLAETKAIDTTGFQEFTARADKAKETAVATLTAALENSRARDAERAELERLRQEAAERAAREEAERIEREKQEAAARAAEQAERDRIEAARRAEEDRKAAEERARQREEAAARQERQRIEDERRAEEEAQRRREADRTHRATVNNAAVSALVTAGLSDAAAKAAITAIAKGSVPHVAIAY